MLFTSHWIVELSILGSTLAALLYKYFTRHFHYWTQRGVYNPKPALFFGNIFDICAQKLGIGFWLKKLYDATDEPYFGIFIFDKPALVLKSPDVIKHILVKDFNNFTDRTVAIPNYDEIFANFLFSKKSPDWKKLRSKLTPLFTSGKLKGMFPLMNNIGVKLTNHLSKYADHVEMKEVSAKFTTEVIAKCAFGINAHCFDEENAMFRQVGRSMFEFSLRNALVQTLYFFRPDWVDFFRVYFFPKWVTNYLTDVFNHVLKERKNDNVKVNDLVDILNDLKKNKEFLEDVDFEGNKAVAHAIQFFAAGFETNASTIAFTLYELCMNPVIQNKLRNEIVNNVKKHGGITYDGILEMKYLDMCIHETLRKYPVLPFLDRVCNEDYTIPGTNLTVERGMIVYVPMCGLHYDEQYFPEPQIYKPERFVDENSKKENMFYLPFGGGPRYCTGNRFGLATTKIGVAHIISQFEVEKTDATPDPIEFESRSFVLQSKVGIPMKIRKIVPLPA